MLNQNSIRNFFKIIDKLELELELESNLHSNTIKIVNNLGMLLSAVQDIQISRELLLECPSKD